MVGNETERPVDYYRGIEDCMDALMAKMGPDGKGLTFERIFEIMNEIREHAAKERRFAFQDLFLSSLEKLEACH